MAMVNKTKKQVKYKQQEIVAINTILGTFT
jgi:hypothetical protein